MRKRAHAAVATGLDTTARARYERTIMHVTCAVPRAAAERRQSKRRVCIRERRYMGIFDRLLARSERGRLGQASEPTTVDIHNKPLECQFCRHDSGYTMFNCTPR